MIEITYHAELVIDNEALKPFWRTFEWQRPEYTINYDPFAYGHYANRQSHQPINDQLPEWAAATHYLEIELDGYSSTFQIDADTAEELQERIEYLKGILLK